MESSAPFLSVDFFIGLADIKVLKKGDQLLRLKDHASPVTIFIKTQLLESYIPSLLKLDYDFILIAGCNDDMCVPYGTFPCRNLQVKELYDSLLSFKHLLRLYSKNICLMHPKLAAIPIGPKMQWISDDFFGEPKDSVIAVYSEYFLEPLNKFKDSMLKPNLLYTNITPGTTDFTFYSEHQGLRRRALDALQRNGFQVSPYVDNESYIRALQSHKFCISPPGRGIDTHRTWEALMVGTIPICLASSLDPIYAKLPVLLVDDYSKITEKFLLEQYTILKNKTTYDFSVLYTDYWAKEILGTVDKKPRESYTALIIEPRQHPALRFVLQNFLENLDSQWNFILYHGLDNEQWMKSIVHQSFSPEDQNRITFRKIGLKNLTLDQYSSIMTNPQFIQSIPTEMFLVFQTDSMICKPYKHLIYDFMEYDYAGSPWHEVPCDRWKTQVGNGGLSLRRKSAMLKIARTIPYSPGYPEDMYFSEGCDKLAMKKPTWAKAKEFAIEMQPNSKSFGIHSPWRWTIVTEDQCPGYLELVKLNSLSHLNLIISA